MPTLLMLSMLGTTPQFAVVVTRRIGVDHTRAEAIAGHLAATFQAHGAPKLGTLLPQDEFRQRLTLAGAEDPIRCAGAPECAAAVGTALKVARVVSVQLVALGAHTTLDAALLEVPSGKSLGALTLTVKPDTDLTPSVLRLLSSVPDLPPPPVLVRQAVEPAIPGVAITSPPWPARRKVALGVGAGAVVAAGVGIGLGLRARAAAEGLRKAVAGEPVATFESDQNSVRLTAGLADACFVAAVGAAITALVLWLTSPGDQALPRAMWLAPDGLGLRAGLWF